MSDKIHTYFSEESIQSHIDELAGRISKDYSKLLKPQEELLVIVTLKGAIYFAADLLRKLTIPTKVEFVRVSSYGKGTKSSGAVRILKDVECNPAVFHVLIVDEIVDSGHTLQFLRARLQASNCKSVQCCALLSKPSRREVSVPLEYCGTEVEDKFLVGYGLDYQEKYRNLKEIAYLE